MARIGKWYRQHRHAAGDEAAHPGVNSFRAYIAAVLPRFEFSPHLEDLIDLLEAVERGDEDRVIIVWPPRHGKTWTCSHMFPGWFLGRHPDQELIHVGHTERFARDKYGRRVRNIIGSAAYRDVFPHIELAKDSRAADLWHTGHDGVYVSAGIGSAIAGRGGDLVLIDDPVRKQEAADSDGSFAGGGGILR